MRHFLVILFAFTSLYGLGQDEPVPNKRLSYGLSPYFTIGSDFNVKGNNSRYGGLGADMFATYRVRNQFVHGKVGYKRYVYGKSFSKVTIEDIHLLAAYKHPLPQAKGMNVILGYNPAFVIRAIDKFNGNQDSIAPINISKELKNRLSHGLYLGLEFQSKERGSFELGYTHILNKGRTNDYLDAIPSHFTIGYNFKFDTKANVPEDVFLARTTLAKLKTDTLYFINRACPDDFTSSQLDSILNENYNYSAYRILKDDEIAKVSTQPNVVHFAVIGKHYGGLEDPESTGIYLLDNKLNNTKFPYPYHTSNPKNGNGLSSCIGDVGNASSLIRTFNKRLYEKY